MLDEPTIGLDPIGRASVWDRIVEVRASTGMTVLVTTHYMDEADQHCDRTALMHRGRIRALGTPAELKAQIGPDATCSAPPPATSWPATPEKGCAMSEQLVVPLADWGESGVAGKCGTRTSAATAESSSPTSATYATKLTDATYRGAG